MINIKFKTNVGEYYDMLCRSYFNKYKKQEKWRPVVINGVSSNYLISNYGRLRNINTEEMPSISIINDHFVTYIRLNDGSVKSPIGTYRLVALMFIPIPQKYLDMGYTIDTLVVDHIRDGDEDNLHDNTVWNLQWLTYRENISKAANCGLRPAFPIDFRDKLDKMILDDYCNKDIYDWCLSEYGYKKEDMKALIQVRRRRLGKTLKEHHEEPKEFTKKIDELIMKGYTNREIYAELGMPLDGRKSGRLVQYRRSLMKVPDQKSKYFTNEQNEKVNLMIEQGKGAQEILRAFDLDSMSEEEINKLRNSIYARCHLYRKKHQ